MRHLRTTARRDLRDGAGANTKFWLDPSVYTLNRVPNPAMLQAIPYLDIGFIRERWWPDDPGQRAAFASLTRSGVGLFLIIGDMDESPDRIWDLIATLAASPFADSVIGVSGPNEANKTQDATWPARAVMIQQAIHNAVFAHPRFAAHVAVVGPALMHNNVKDLDHDYRALRKAGIVRWCDAGDFHFYPGNAGPILNSGEAKRAREAFGRLPMWHSETGWTGADTDPVTAGKFSVEALLRNHLSGIVGTMLYEFVDESQYVEGREGKFGLRTPYQPKPAYAGIHSLLATRDGKEPFHGWLADYAPHVKSDAGAVVTSEGNNRWTVYLMRQVQTRATIVVPRHHHHRPNKYVVPLTESMTVVHVSA